MNELPIAQQVDAHELRLKRHDEAWEKLFKRIKLLELEVARLTRENEQLTEALEEPTWCEVYTRSQPKVVAHFERTDRPSLR